MSKVDRQRADLLYEEVMRMPPGDKPFMLEIDKSEAWDIDEELDFEITDFLMKRRSVSR